MSHETKQEHTEPSGSKLPRRSISRSRSPSERPMPSKAFRFKGERSSRQSGLGSSQSHHKPSRRRRGRSRSRSPASRVHQCDRSRSPGPRPRSLSPDTAFRESLFDALADDEGAAYWEGVYGQPIHIYPRPEQSGDTYEGKDYNNPDVLDADAYAAYVRRKMWEKSHQHILEERARREQAAQRAREEKLERERLRKEAQEKGDYWDDFRRKGGERGPGGADSSFADDLEAGLRRGEKRREDKRWKSAWAEYARKWDMLLATAKRAEGTTDEADNKADPGSAVQLPWPVISGRESDVDAESVRKFFRQITKADPSNTVADAALESTNSNALRSQLKLERVRWHPDKMTQRFAFAIDEQTLASVTAVFQVVDQMWSEEKSMMAADKI